MKVLIFPKRLCRTQKQILFILIVFMICLTAFYFKRKTIKFEDLSDTNRLVQKRLKEIVKHEKGTGCIMPKLDPFAEEIMKFDEYSPQVTCEGTDWVDCYKSHCFVVKEILKNMRDIVCTYKDIVYVNDEHYYLGGPTKVIGDDVYTLNISDHVQVSCKGMDINGLGIFSSQWYGHKAGFRLLPTAPVPPGRQESLNVLILGFDSTSRNAFIRKMRKSYKSLVGNMKAVFMKSYNIIGDGAAGALFPLLTGKRDIEYLDSGKQSEKHKYVDEKGMIFNILKEYGYRTAYFEDSPWIGNFQWKFNGFRQQPADHYLQPFFQEANNGKKLHQGFPAQHCVGAIPQYQLMMNLADELDGNKFCFTLISDMSHDNFNVMSTADEALVSFLNSLIARRTLEDTLVIIMGDHGTRFSNVSETYQGKLEERLPLMAIILPEKLKKLRPNALSALKHNSEVLTTPFDIHATLPDVLDLKDKINKYTIPGSDLARAMTLLERLPKSRSCAEAGVMPHWCACTKWYNVTWSNPMYRKVANILAEYIDRISEGQRSKCARRTLVSIEWVLRQSANNHLLKYGYILGEQIDRYLGNTNKVAPKAPDEYYQAKITMSPGKAVFEGTMIYNTVNDYFMITQRDISRVNAYGNEPSCVGAAHPHLHKFCYCNDRLYNHTLVEYISSDAY